MAHGVQTHLRVLNKKPDDVLLSHREALHYHWRKFVSLLSSKWDQVVPSCYCHQANWYVTLQSLKLMKIHENLLKVT